MKWFIIFCVVFVAVLAVEMCKVASDSDDREEDL